MLFAQTQSTWKQLGRLLLDSISRCGITEGLNQGRELKAGLKIHQDQRNQKLFWVYENQIDFLLYIYKSKPNGTIQVEQMCKRCEQAAGANQPGLCSTAIVQITTLYNNNASHTIQY